MSYGFYPWVRKIPWSRKWQLTPILLPGKSHGMRSLAGYSPWGHKESDRTEHARIESGNLSHPNSLSTCVCGLPGTLLSWTISLIYCMLTVKCSSQRTGRKSAWLFSVQFSSFQSLSPVRLFATPWTAARQASLSITNSGSLLKLMSIEAMVMPFNHLILCGPLLLPSIFPSIKVFSKESLLRIKWPQYYSFSFNISPSNEHPGLISFRMDWLLQGVSFF